MFFTSRFNRFPALLAASLLFAAIQAPVARSVEIPVSVGGTGDSVLKFTPDSVTANVGDVVIFTFKQKNHTVTQSTLASPCQPKEGGFDSGFVPVGADVTDAFPVAPLTVKDTNPIWVYCRQANHCQQGMVFAVNPGNEMDAFRAAATGGAVSSTVPSTTPAASGVVTVTATVTVTQGGSETTMTTTYGSWPGSASPTSAVSQDHRVVVGGPGKLVFDPSNITAQAGDTVTFEFRQKNHTVTQSSFAAPCVGLSAASGKIGFDSGFMSVGDSDTNFPTYTIQINDTEPIWAYCKQGNHCGQGMVFSVNAIESGPNNFAAFQAKAKQINGTSASGASSAPTSSATTVPNAASSVRSAGSLLVAAAGLLIGSTLL